MFHLTYFLTRIIRFWHFSSAAFIEKNAERYLWLVYINYIKNCTNKLTILSFADDTTVYISNPSVDEMVDIVNTELKKLYGWLCANRLSLNIKKTNFCIFSPTSNKHNIISNKTITLNDQIINQIGDKTKMTQLNF